MYTTEIGEATFHGMIALTILARERCVGGAAGVNEHIGRQEVFISGGGANGEGSMGSTPSSPPRSSPFSRCSSCCRVC